MHDMRSVRSSNARSVGFVDSIDFEDGFQTLELDFSPLANMTPWPKTFESHLRSMPPVALCKKLDQITNAERGKDLSYLDHPPHHLSALGSSVKCGTPDSAEPEPISAELEEAATCSTGLLPQIEAPRRGVHYQQFSGFGTDADRFECNGILHPLPPQNGIPGWHRITMLKYFPSDLVSDAGTPSASSPNHPSSAKGDDASNDEDTKSSSPASSQSHSSQSSASSTSSISPPVNWPSPAAFTPINGNYATQMTPDDVDIDNSCWAYEGVVLPGGKIMLGRWWSPTQDADEFLCMGPFIFWEVEGEA